ncbi:MAG: cation:proton antiporter [Pseudomonadota bacterium]
MNEIWAIVFGLSVLLALAVLLQPVAKVLRLPHTVLLALVGVGIAWLVSSLGLDPEGHGALEPVGDGHEASDGHGPEHGTHHASGPWWQQALLSLTSLNMTANLIMFVFLPALVFESAMSLDLRKLRKELGAILFLAVIGLLISATIAGFSLQFYSGMAIVVCLLIGAIVSATDPVAVIALFKDLGAPKRLTILVEGESLFNDATAIVVAGILLSLLTASAEPSAAAALLNFFKVFLGGIIVGALLTRVMIEIMKPFRNHAISVVSLTLVLPFVAFVVAEHFLHVSGVMAAVVGGLAMGSHGRKVIPPQIFAEIEHSWHQIAFWATALIFILVGLAVPALLGEDPFEYFDEALLLFAVATIGRAIIIFGFIPLLERLRLVAPVSRSFQAIMVWGGLRGAVSLALALVVLDYPGVDTEAAHFVAVLVTFFVFATLILQATTISTVMKMLGLGKLSAFDETLRNRSVAWAKSSVRDELEHVVALQGSEPAAFEDILAQYEPVKSSGEDMGEAPHTSTAEWVQAGLNLALGQERQFYLEAYGDGAISGARLRELLGRIEDSIEAVRNAPVDGDNDLEGLRKALGRFTQHSATLSRAVRIQRRSGLVGPLADALTLRFSVLSAARSALRRQSQEGLGEVAALLPPDASDQFRELYDYRVGLIERAHNALWLQYPEFAAGVDRRNVARAGQRLEVQAYNRLNDNGMIGPEVYGALMASLDERANLIRLPKLVIKYDPLELISNVPLFETTTATERRKISRQLNTVFALPGEQLIAVGDPGDSMYFVADGVVEIRLPDGNAVELGSGEFFGELALINDAPRVADVYSEGFSTLLKLRKKDFQALVDRNPSLGTRIRDEAARRTAQNA